MSILGILYWLSRLIAIAAIIHVVMGNRQPAKTIAWALVIYFVPLVGVVAYIFLGTNTRKERQVNRRSMDQLEKRSMLGFVQQKDLQLPEPHKPVIDLFVNESFSLPFNGNSVEMLTDGYQFFPLLLSDIASAKSHIHIDIYIFDNDALGLLVSDALIAKARQGVEVRVIYDDVGCWNVKNKFFERMRVEGIEVEPFMPVRFPSFARRANYRNHRKLFVIDGRVGYIGGMNIALRYVKGRNAAKDKHSRWRDTMLRIEGRGVYTLQRAFLVDWYFVDRTLLSDRKYYPEGAGDGAKCLLQTVTSGPTSPYPEIMQGYVRIIMAARRYVYIETPYFLPTMAVLYALKTAAQAGVDVRVLIPYKSDARFTALASRSYLREAMGAGVQIGMYTPGFLHSKLMVCDDTIATCGSTNMDFRSFENNFEANAFIYDEDFARRVRQVFLDDENDSLTLASYLEKNGTTFIARLGESFARLFSPLL